MLMGGGFFLRTDIISEGLRGKYYFSTDNLDEIYSFIRVYCDGNSAKVFLDTIVYNENGSKIGEKQLLLDECLEYPRLLDDFTPKNK